jgi:hypothetical protein
LPKIAVGLGARPIAPEDELTVSRALELALFYEDNDASLPLAFTL